MVTVVFRLNKPLHSCRKSTAQIVSHTIAFDTHIPDTTHSIWKMVQDATTILRASLNHVPSSHILQVIACRHRAPQSDQCSPLRRNTARQGHAISILAPLPRSAALRPPRCSDLHVLSHARRKAVRLHRS